MGSRWAVVDELVHELGSLRAVVDEADAEPNVAEADVTLELRACLAQAADTIHLVIGGDDQMVAQAWRSIAAAQEVGKKARTALEKARAVRTKARHLGQESAAHRRETQKHIRGLRDLRDTGLVRRRSADPDKES